VPNAQTLQSGQFAAVAFKPQNGFQPEKHEHSPDYLNLILDVPRGGSVTVGSNARISLSVAERIRGQFQRSRKCPF